MYIWENSRCYGENKGKEEAKIKKKKLEGQKVRGGGLPYLKKKKVQSRSQCSKIQEKTWKVWVSQVSVLTGERGAAVLVLRGQHWSCAWGTAKRALCGRERAGGLRIHLETNSVCLVATVWVFILNLKEIGQICGVLSRGGTWNSFSIFFLMKWANMINSNSFELQYLYCFTACVQNVKFRIHMFIYQMSTGIWILHRIGCKDKRHHAKKQQAYCTCWIDDLLFCYFLYKNFLKKWAPLIPGLFQNSVATSIFIKMNQPKNFNYL